MQKKNQRYDEWEMKNDDVTICEVLGHGAFGKVYKGIMKVSSLKKKAQSTITVAVKMLQGMLKQIDICLLYDLRK